MGPSVSQLRALMEARERYARLDQEARAAKQERNTREMEVHEAMEEAGWKGAHSIDLGEPWGVQRFTANATIFADVYDEDALVEWAAKHGYADAMLGERTVRKAALNQYVRQQLNTHGALPEGVEHKRTRYVTVSSS